MSENRRDAEMDGLLRRSMSAPVPELTAGFEARVLREVKHAQLDRSGRWLLAGYGVMAVAVSAGVMRGQGLGWDGIAVTILGSLGVAAALGWLIGLRRRLAAAPVAS